MDKESYSNANDRTVPKKGIPALCAIIAVLFFAVCLTGAAWAWYSSSVTSGENVIAGANFYVTVETDVEASDGWYLYDGETAKTLTLVKTGSSAASGYCVIEAVSQPEEGQAETSVFYCTPPLGDTLSVTVIGAGRIKITPMWGISAEVTCEELVNSGMIQLYVAPEQNSELPSEQTGEPIEAQGREAQEQGEVSE